MKITTFLSLIKDSCKEQLSIHGLQASIIASIGCLKSQNGNSKSYTSYNNIFEMLDENGEYKKYNNPTESIEDFVNYLVHARKGNDNNSPFKYKSIFNISDYKKALSNLLECGYIEDQKLVKEFEKSILDIIANNKLLEWDKEVQKELESEISEFIVKLKGKEIYRDTIYENVLAVFKENRGSKIFTDNDEEIIPEGSDIILYYVEKEDGTVTEYYEDLELCKEIANESNGKIYNMDNEVIYTTKSNDDRSNYNIYREKGDPVVLKRTPVYSTSESTEPYVLLTGEFYYYESKVINGRIRITGHKDIDKYNTTQILGFIKVR